MGLLPGATHEQAEKEDKLRARAQRARNAKAQKKGSGALGQGDKKGSGK